MSDQGMNGGGGGGGGGRRWGGRGAGGGGRGRGGGRGGGGGDGGAMWGGGGRGRGAARGGGRGGGSNRGPPRGNTVSVGGGGDGGNKARSGRGGGGSGRGGGNPPQAALNLDEAFCMRVHAELQDLVEDGSRDELSFPSDLDNHQRRYIHSMAEKYGLFTKSSGKGDKRFIHVAKVKKNARMEQISLRLPPIRVDACVAEPPMAVARYLEQYPLPTPTSTADPWCVGESQASWRAQHSTDQYRRAAPPLFRPLRSSTNKAPRHRPRTASSAQKPRPMDLPVHGYRQQILEAVERHQVIVISGDTGCGKSTQIPQFLLDDMLERGRGHETRIICSQPRRLSAISLAERVAKERASRGGGGDALEVGHAIRFDSAFDAHRSKLIFCTTGTLLKWLNSDPLALGFSHLILDEVHERDQFTDFLLILLKSNILRQRRDLKVILMSATIQVEKFARYFQPEFEAPMIEMVGGRCFPVTTLFLEDILAVIHHANTTGGATNFAKYAKAAITEDPDAKDRDDGQVQATSDLEDDDDDDDEPAMGLGLLCPLCQSSDFPDEASFGMHVATCFGGPVVAAANPQKPPKQRVRKKAKPAAVAMMGDVLNGVLVHVEEGVKTSLLESYVRQEDALSRDQSVDYTLLLQLLYMIEQVFPLSDTESAAAILVFLPGWEEISYMERELLRSSMTASVYEIALLHSRLSAQEQRRAFLKPPRGKRKLILATNIAETSLTIEDVVFVIDCGKSKQAHALATTSSASFVMGLQTTWVAKANCVQRMGRAGRVRPGICFRLFSRARYETAMKEFMVPELLTTPLEELLLHIKLLQYEKKLQIDDAKGFLMRAMDSPSETAIDATLARLEAMRALEPGTQALSLLGWHLAHVCDSGVSVHMGKLLLWGHVFGSFAGVTRTTCALSGYRDPFLNFLGMTPDELRQVELSKATFLRDAGAPFRVQSDHLVLLLALEDFLQFHPRAYGEMETFCRRNMLHRPTLEQVTSILRQLERDLEALGMTPTTQLATSVAPAAHAHAQTRSHGARRGHGGHARVPAAGPPARWPVTRLAPYFMALGAGLYPSVLYTKRNSTSRNWTSKEKVKVRIDSSSMLAKGTTSRQRARDDQDDDDDGSGDSLEWLVYHEMMQSERTRVAKHVTKLPSFLVVLLLMGHSEQLAVESRGVEADDDQAGETTTTWLLTIDEWIAFEFASLDALERLLGLRRRLELVFLRHLDRLHEAHLHQQQQQQQQQHHHHQTDPLHPPSSPPTLPHDPMREAWHRHDRALVDALVAWVADDLIQSNPRTA